MASKRSTIESLTALFDGSVRPIYAVNSNSQIVYCNRALADWMALEPKRILGRIVEFHSEPAADAHAHTETPLTDLCPPPRASAGEPCTGTISCLATDGRLAHRHAEFIPVSSANLKSKQSTRQQLPARSALLVMLAEADMSAQDLSAELTDEPTSDELHRTIRRFRRAQGRRFSIESVLGSTGAMQKVRSQIGAAIASGANTLICGRHGSGRGHIARAIHYGAAGGDEAKLLPIDCKLLNDDLFRRVLDAASTNNSHDDDRITLLFENVEEMSAGHQSFLARAIGEQALKARVLATSGDAPTRSAQQRRDGEQIVNQEASGEMPDTKPGASNSELFELLSTITIQLPRLVDRIEDLPVLSQYFLEACNEGSAKQIGSIRAEALDMLALYNWPGELAQLREVICTAHRNCKSHEISAADLPPILRHASQAASRVRRAPEPIVLDDLLASIEKEVIARALMQANGNKSGAASLLGITRPRLYRRLVQLGMVTETEADSEELPEFIERDAAE